MRYLDAFESELTRAGIPARRRARILFEFADHLHEDPAATRTPTLSLGMSPRSQSA